MSLISTIDHAVSVLLYKNIHLPVEADADFADEPKASAKPENPKTKQLLQLIQQKQILMLQQQQELAQVSRSPRRSGYAAATYDDQAASSAMLNTANSLTPAPQVPVRGIRQGPAMYTQDGRIVCGRCHLLGCRRINGRRLNATCPYCN